MGAALGGTGFSLSRIHLNIASAHMLPYPQPPADLVNVIAQHRPHTVPHARRIAVIAAENGVYGPYGPYNGAEWNHYQLIPLLSVTAGNPLRRTITGQGPISTALMWLASGVGLTSIAPATVQPVLIAARARRYHRVYYARHRHYWRLARHG